ncbi:hypothetical protein CMEL01_16032 [Colletotrichum melonis]|uniref:Uncharacterized protein n=1 Tax=Colletotrichum melonis TaxID=1209925 RepID=A0AAI9UES1_9PEZI|nr:hypothetical protein CMEL01_16032 [Colletotrichum melonis]
MRVRRASVQVCALVPTALQRHWFYLVYLRSTVCIGSNSSTTGSAWNDSAGGGSGRRREERKEEAEKVKDRLPNYEAEADEKTDRRRSNSTAQHSNGRKHRRRGPLLFSRVPPPSIRIVAGYPSPLPLTRDLQLAADVDSDGAVVRYVYAVCTSTHPLPLQGSPSPPPLSTTSSASRPKDNGPPPSTSSSDPNSHIPPLLILMEPAQQAQVGSILLFWWPGEQTLEPVPVS